MQFRLAATQKPSRRMFGPAATMEALAPTTGSRLLRPA
jgi:hypothetical protein